MKVDLVSHDASDLKCVNAARVSYNTHHEELTEGDQKLIHAMLREGHGSVFEHSTFSFRVEAPIAVVRQWHRHRVGHSYNEMSARYVEMPKKFYTPEARVQEGKAMAYKYVKLTEDEQIKGAIQSAYDYAYKKYQKLINEYGIAKEAARYVLPVGLETQMYWTCNARSLMHFLELRTDVHAMQEIRICALQAEDIFKEIMPITWKAWWANGKKAP